MDVFNLMGEILSQCVCVYKIILYTFIILEFCQLYPSKAEKNAFSFPLWGFCSHFSELLEGLPHLEQSRDLQSLLPWKSVQFTFFAVTATYLWNACDYYHQMPHENASTVVLNSYFLQCCLTLWWTLSKVSLLHCTQGKDGVLFLKIIPSRHSMNICIDNKMLVNVLYENGGTGDSSRTFYISLVW